MTAEPKRAKAPQVIKMSQGQPMVSNSLQKMARRRRAEISTEAMRINPLARRASLEGREVEMVLGGGDGFVGREGDIDIVTEGLDIAEDEDLGMGEFALVWAFKLDKEREEGGEVEETEIWPAWGDTGF